MNWRFWQRKEHKRRSARTGARSGGGQDQRKSAGRLLMSAAELVSLQRLVGNRAVVNLLKRN
ncbi:MAG TPA: hypothetical protein VE863_08760 [Pyrinomonadaceae bacterium]|jgi:hypothetical protein|nr:hypothetical protein [Pyrinomonadaceae bacterium]